MPFQGGREAVLFTAPRHSANYAPPMPQANHGEAADVGHMSYTYAMEQVGMRELNQHASRVIERVKLGQVIEVTDRGRPVARVVPVVQEAGLLDLLLREGRALAPSSSGPIPMPPMIGNPDSSAAAAVSASRENERW